MLVPGGRGEGRNVVKGGLKIFWLSFFAFPRSKVFFLFFGVNNCWLSLGAESFGGEGGGVRVGGL